MSTNNIYIYTNVTVYFSVLFLDLVIEMANKLKRQANTSSEEVTLYVEEQEQTEDDSTASVSGENSTPGFFTSYRKKKRATTTVLQSGSVNEQVAKYLATEIDDEVNPFNFWDKHADELSDLYRVAKQVLIVPATSAPVERLFSHGGIVTRPHRASIGDKTLSNIIFLKCNRLR